MYNFKLREGSFQALVDSSPVPQHEAAGAPAAEAEVVPEEGLPEHLVQAVLHVRVARPHLRLRRDRLHCPEIIILISK